MPTVDVLDLNNQKVGEVELADAVFGAEVNEALLYEAVRHYLAGKRAGTHKVKTRHEVAGSGKKLWKQKGTGRARMGSVRSPLWRHGGTVHGPVPRDYSYKLPRKMQLGALRSALSAKLRDGDLQDRFGVPAGRSQDQELLADAGKVRCDEKGSARRDRREPQSRTERAQSRRRGSGAQPRSASLSSARRDSAFCSRRRRRRS